MQIHWTKFAGFRESARLRIESRLARLAYGHRDLVDIHIAAQETEHQQARHQVKITCSAHGHAITVAKDRRYLRCALHDVLQDFEREVHAMRDRHRSLERAARTDHADVELPTLEA